MLPAAFSSAELDADAGRGQCNAAAGQSGSSAAPGSAEGAAGCKDLAELRAQDEVSSRRPALHGDRGSGCPQAALQIISPSAARPHVRRWCCRQPAPCPALPSLTAARSSWRGPLPARTSCLCTAPASPSTILTASEQSQIAPALSHLSQHCPCTVTDHPDAVPDFLSGLVDCPSIIPAPLQHCHSSSVGTCLPPTHTSGGLRTGLAVAYQPQNRGTRHTSVTVPGRWDG